MNKIAWMLAGLVAACSVPACAADDAGAGLAMGTQAWARWQGRVSFGTTAPIWRSAPFAPDNTVHKLSSLALMGDYYLSSTLTGLGSSGGFRATGGVILGPRAQAWAAQPGASTGNAFSIGTHLFGPTAVPYSTDAAPDNATLPYLGLGYTALSARSGWSFSADLGLIAQSPGNVVRLGRGQSLDDVVRDLRLAPVLQVGVSYSF